MEITKTSNSYSIKDSADGVEITGNVVENVDGVISINLNATYADDGADYYYTVSNGRVSVNYSAAESNKDNFVSRADTIVVEVLKHIANEN
jgi:hypothetical protein